MTDLRVITSDGTDRILEENTVQDFAANLRGPLLRPGDRGYDEARKVWNGMIDRRPALIARCAGVADVMAAVRFARTNGLLVSVKGGIPGPILNVGMVGGGYFVWQLGPRYLDLFDGRALPFSTEVSLIPGELLGAPPNAPVWRRAVERYGVNTVLFTFAGFDFLLLWQFCTSDEWAPLYLDQTAAIFVRQRPENEDLIRRLRINCAIGFRSGAETRSAILGTGSATDLRDQR